MMFRNALIAFCFGLIAGCATVQPALENPSECLNRATEAIRADYEAVKACFKLPIPVPPPKPNP